MSAALTLERYLADVVREPRKHLTASQITHLRLLVDAGVASKVPGGWVCRGTRYKDGTFRGFIGLDLAFESFHGGHHALRPTARARSVIALLAQRHSKAG